MVKDSNNKTRNLLSLLAISVLIPSVLDEFKFYFARNVITIWKTTTKYLRILDYLAFKNTNLIAVNILNSLERKLWQEEAGRIHVCNYQYRNKSNIYFLHR